MPRQRGPHSDDEQGVVIDLRMHRGRGRPPKVEDEDPRLALPDGNVLDQKPEKRTKDQRSGGEQFSFYVSALAANNGDYIKALAATYGISEDEAAKNAKELHEKIRINARSGVALHEMFERHDLTREARFAVLRACLYSASPAVALKAIEMLEEVDMTGKAARIGSSWEDIVRMVKERASRGKKK